MTITRDCGLMRLIVRILASTTGVVLITFTVTYYLTYEPAPEIRILWRAGIEPERRAELEHRFLLVNPHPFEDRLTYDLLDTSPGNVEALVHERDIADTDRVDRVGFTIPPDIPYGASWMWVGYRLPVLRTPGVIEGVVLISAIVLALSAGALVFERQKASRPPSAVTQS